MESIKEKNIHFIGIGGIGMSSLAQILHRHGKKITGSDVSPSEITKSLKLSGIPVEIGQKKENIKSKHQLVVYSPAIPASNPEYKQAKEIGIKMMTYPQALGLLTKNYYTIAIAGTHGKSTTTAMTALMTIEAGLDPTVVIGTKMKELNNKNYRVGESKYLIIDACEYKDSFLNFTPDILIITNIEADHLDYFKNLKTYKEAFQKLANKVPKDGYIILNADNSHSKSIKAKAQFLKWSRKKGQDFYLNGNTINQEIRLKPKVPGKFNVENAAGAAIAGIKLGLSAKVIEKGINKFQGTWRRMEYKRKILGKTKFIDDYAHHPTEIKATLTAIREAHPKDKILCIFQPHQYSRTKLLLKEFGDAFNLVDEVIIPNIYRVRDSEADVKSVSVKDLVEVIKKNKTKIKNGKSLENTAQIITNIHSKFDLIVTMGAGNITEIYKML